MLITIPVQDGFLQLPHVVGFVAVEEKLTIPQHERPEGTQTWKTRWVPTAITVAGTKHKLLFVTPDGDDEDVADLNNAVLGFEQATKACEMVVGMISNMLFQQQVQAQIATEQARQGRTESGLVVPS